MVLLGGAGAMASTGVVAVHLTLILLSMLRGARAGVVADFNHAQHCNAFLYMGTPPRGYLRQASYRKICQQYEDRPRYVTLYDPRKRIPVYSAYTFQKSDDEKTVDFPWMFEPQVSLFQWLECWAVSSFLGPLCEMLFGGPLFCESMVGGFPKPLRSSGIWCTL